MADIEYQIWRGGRLVEDASAKTSGDATRPGSDDAAVAKQVRAPRSKFGERLMNQQKELMAGYSDEHLSTKPVTRTMRSL